MDPATTVAEFVTFLRRRGLTMLLAGIASIVVGVAVLFLFHDTSTLVIFISGLIFCGGALVYSGIWSQRIAGQARAAFGGSYRSLLMSTSLAGPVGKSYAKSIMRGTLWIAGSSSRRPLGEFKSAGWFSPHLDASNAVAYVYGSITRGHTIVAVTDNGAVVGRMR